MCSSCSQMLFVLIVLSKEWMNQPSDKNLIFVNTSSDILSLQFANRRQLICFNEQNKCLLKMSNFETGFKFDHVWNMLKNVEKFHDNDTTRRQVCGKHPYDYSTSQSDSQTPDCNTPEFLGFSQFSMNLNDDNDGIGGFSYERPIGVNKAKLKKKIGEQRKKDSNMLDEELKEMIKNAKAERLQLIELQKQQLYEKQQHRLFKQQQADVKQKNIDIAREDKILEKDLSSIDDPTCAS
ncbi:hypothetical protein BUALT_Bualt16G0038600 [Buddleja alternifolia]|uniref:No apical meristem-associated C-terminal domain-containing protein n=1 Tax=Buddleja alternifolia TaxID=168488 RepID=A0AAV6WGM8_9LAMI|nr:hypothetical protein BUALT_Bualt16G0038600 [Buddleja alternifolia]